MATGMVAVLILFFVEHFGCLLKAIYDLQALRQTDSHWPQPMQSDARRPSGATAS